MKVTAKFADQSKHDAIRKIIFQGPLVLTLNPISQINDGWFAPIAGMHGQFESYALRAEKMFDAIILLGGSDLVAAMLNIGQGLSPDLGWADGGYTHGLKAWFGNLNYKTNLSLAAVHFTDWVFEMAMDAGELGKLDFEHQEFDEFIQSLRDNLVQLNKQEAENA